MNQSGCHFVSIYQNVLINCTCRSPGFNLPVWPQKSSWAMVPSKTYVTCQKTKTVKKKKKDNSYFLEAVCQFFFFQLKDDSFYDLTELVLDIKSVSVLKPWWPDWTGSTERSRVQR